MKRTIKTYFKFFMLFFGITLLLVNCEKEDYSDISKNKETIQESSKNQISKARFITRTTIDNSNLISKALEKYSSKHSSDTQNRDIYSTVYGFSIDTDDAVLSIDSIYKTYTFKINREEPQENLLENLLIVIDTVTNETTQLLVKYPIIDEDTYDYENASIEEIYDENLTYEKFSAECYTITLDPIRIDFGCPWDAHYGDNNPCSDGVQRGYTLEYGGGTVEYCPDSGGATPDTNNSPPLGGGNGTYTNNPISTGSVGTIPNDLMSPALSVSTCLTTGYPDGTFGDFTTEMNDWVNNAVSGTSEGRAVLALNTYLQANECSEEAREFAINEIDIYLLSPYSEPILTHFSIEHLTNECAKQVAWTEIMSGTNAGLVNLIRNMFNNDANVTLDIRNTDLVPSNANASTDLPTNSEIASGVYQISIGISNDFLNNNPTKLAIALVSIHEMVHAKLIYDYLHGNLLTEYPGFTDLNTAFGVFIDSDRTDADKIALNDAMHVSMVSLLGTMSYSLYKYAQAAGMDSITAQYCSEITKGSFYNTPAMSLIDTGSSTPEELNNKYVNEQDNTPNALGDDCD